MGIIKAIPLTDEQAAAVERLVEAGVCADATEVVAAGLEALIGESIAIDAWLRQEVLPVAREMEAHPERRLTSEQVHAAIEARFQDWENGTAR